MPGAPERPTTKSVRGTLARVMSGAGATENEAVQLLNSIYAWSRLLEVRTSSDATLVTQAVQNIQQNAERLLRKMVEGPEVS